MARDYAFRSLPNNDQIFTYYQVKALHNYGMIRVENCEWSIEIVINVLE
ncbi:MAG: hypothetical protein GDA56_15860 [Hormoscilla sp. GM7CHS1pb]|nr:hypothetical protein [Hormoscilla sp. GM7CHS1pb]